MLVLVYLTILACLASFGLAWMDDLQPARTFMMVVLGLTTVYALVPLGTALVGGFTGPPVYLTFVFSAVFVYDIR